MHKHKNLVSFDQIGVLCNKEVSFNEFRKHKLSRTGLFSSWIKKV